MAIYWFVTGGEFDPETGELINRDVYFSNSQVDPNYILWNDEEKVAEGNIVHIPSNFRIDEPAGSLFYGCNNTTIENIEDVNTLGCESFHSMFSYCKKLTSLDLSKWSTAEVLSTNSMFQGCTNLQNLNLTGWQQLGKLWDLDFMFDGCYNLDTILVADGTDWETQVDQDYHSSSNMFYNCKLLPNYDENIVDISRANDDYGYFKSIHIPKWVQCETYEKVGGTWLKVNPGARTVEWYEAVFWEKY